jgi:asparagine synthase (glutamine-hydrolysing)
MDRWFAGTPKKLKSELDRALVEDKRIRPACYTVSVSGQMMYRVYPYDTFLSDSRVAHCYGRILPKWKLNGEVWGRVAAKICANAGHIVDSNFGWRVDAGKATKLLVFAQGWFGRRLKKPKAPEPTDESHPPSTASWPELGWYAKNSKTLQEFWCSTPAEHRKRLQEVWGSDPWQIPLNEWSVRYYDLFRMLTLLAHWRR